MPWHLCSCNTRKNCAVGAGQSMSLYAYPVTEDKLCLKKKNTSEKYFLFEPHSHIVLIRHRHQKRMKPSINSFLQLAVLCSQNQI
jgi:hypothetical protein